MNTGLRRSTVVLWEELEGEIVVFDPRHDRALRLDSPVALLWKRLDGTNDIPALAAGLACAAADVRTLLANLDQMGLLE